MKILLLPDCDMTSFDCMCEYKIYLPPFFGARSVPADQLFSFPAKSARKSRARCTSQFWLVHVCISMVIVQRVVDFVGGLQIEPKVTPRQSSQHCKINFTLKGEWVTPTRPRKIHGAKYVLTANTTDWTSTMSGLTSISVILLEWATSPIHPACIHSVLQLSATTLMIPGERFLHLCPLVGLMVHWLWFSKLIQMNNLVYLNGTLELLCMHMCMHACLCMLHSFCMHTVTLSSCLVFPSRTVF